MKVLLGAILLLLVGCSGVVQAQGGDTDAQIAALTERVTELENQLNLVEEILQERIEDVRWQQQWTDNDAIVLVQYKFWERASSCRRSDCYFRDPVLRVLYPGASKLPARLRDTFIEMATEQILTGSQWSATHEPGSRRWRVEALQEGEESNAIFVFYAYERAGIVEAEVPSKE
jgi:hypothetical protein